LEGYFNIKGFLRMMITKSIKYLLVVATWVVLSVSMTENSNAGAILTLAIHEKKLSIGLRIGALL